MYAIIFIIAALCAGWLAFGFGQLRVERNDPAQSPRALAAIFGAALFAFIGGLLA